MTDTHLPMTAYDRHQKRQRIAKEQHMNNEESLLERLFIGTMFIVFLVVVCMVPDIMR